MGMKPPGAVRAALLHIKLHVCNENLGWDMLDRVAGMGIILLAVVYLINNP